jgi:hypothetical protein
MIKTEFGLDITNFQENLNKIIKESQEAGKKVAEAFKNASDKGVAPKIDNNSVNQLVQSFKSAELAAKSYLSEQTEIAKAMRFAGLQGTKAYDEVEKSIIEATNELKKFDDAAMSSGKNLTNIGDGAKTGFAGLKDAFKGGQGDIASSPLGGIASSLGALATPTGAAVAGITALGAGLVDAFGKGQEYNRALGDLAAKTGLVGESFDRLAEQGVRAFKGGVGESVAEATKIIGQANTLLGDTFNSDELGDFTTKAAALGKLYDKDINEVLAKSQPFIKQFGLESEEAFNLLALSLKEGGTAQDDVLDSLAEYSQLAVEAGYTAEEFAETLVRGAKEGVFNTDKIADSIKEAQIRLRAGDFQKAFSDIAKSSTPVENAIAKQAKSFLDLGKSGKISVKEAFDGSAKVIKDALAKGDISTSFASQLQVAVAGTPAEDLGTGLYNRIFGAPIDTAEVAKRAAEVGKAVEGATGQYTFLERIQREFVAFQTQFGQGLVSLVNSFEVIFDGWWTYFKTAFVIPFQNIWVVLSDSFAPIKDLLSELFGEGSNDAKVFLSIMKGLGEYVGILVNVALLPLRASIFLISSAIKGLIQFFIDWRNEFKKITSEGTGFGKFLLFVRDAFISIGGFVSTIVKEVVKFFNLLGKSPKAPFKEVSDQANKTKETVKDLNNEIENPPPPDTAPVKREYDSLFDYIKGLKEKINQIDFTSVLAVNDDIVNDLKKQIADLNKSDLSGAKKIELEVILNSQTAVL